MGKYNFDEIIERRGTGALKTDALTERYGRPDLIGAWVADMDFATPPFIMNAMRKRLEHPILGYTVEPAEYKESIIEWEKKLHNIDLEKDWISYIPGIVKGIGMVINVFTKEGEPVIIMPPVYHPFRITTEENKREVIGIPLKEDSEGRYYMDFDALEKLDVRGGVLLLSNPHNPGGRVWSKEELAKLAKICKDKNILVVSDEIHADMILTDSPHVPYISVSEDAAENSIIFCAPSKTFNIPGVVSSFSIVKNKKLRDRFYNWLKANEFNEAPILSYVATIAAYKNGDEWRREMLEYVKENINYVSDRFEREFPEIRIIKPEASFLVWLDCRKLSSDSEILQDLFVNKAKVALNNGAMFGKESSGLMRLNVAMPRKVLSEVINRIIKAAQEYKKIEK